MTTSPQPTSAAPTLRLEDAEGEEARDLARLLAARVPVAAAGLLPVERDVDEARLVAAVEAAGARVWLRPL
ncbi:MAG TPA: hypothetical protein RMH80_09390, partial [Polyangiaceae bacterium LLY-WYZ-15_(1-7)]|nr:hypothetical protein [Polyangiaceae bacterium LLY-WYZ-15_(1-7)]